MDYYFEAAVVGTPRFPEGVHFVVGAFPWKSLTIAFGAEELMASLASKSVCVTHGQKLDSRNFYAIAIMDKRSDLHPCWSIM